MPRAVPKCTADRPGSQTHRTLHVPQAFLDNALDAIADGWTAKLCCTYNHVEITDDSTAYLVTYDGNRRNYDDAATFAEAAQAAHEDVCQMGMGSQDCANGASCIASAEAVIESAPVCCMAVPMCPLGECWAFGCFEVKECCENKNCQGPAPIILIALSAVLAMCIPLGIFVRHRVKRCRRQRERLTPKTASGL